MAVRKLTLVLDMNTGSFSTRIVDATGKLRTFDAAVDRTNVSMAKASQRGSEFGRVMRDVHHNLSFVHVVLLALTTTVGGFTVGLVKMNAEAQRSLALLEGLSTKGTTAARKLDAASNFGFLKEFAKNAPYSLGALTDTFVKLKSVGIDPTKGAMQALIDGVANFGGTESQLHRAAVAIQQMSGKGVISMEELRQQLGEAMPTALRIMAKAAGMSVRDFVKEVSEGKVEAEGLVGTAGKFWTELQAETAGASARLMNTFDGQVQKAKTGVNQLALAIGGLQSNGQFASGGFMDTLITQVKDLNAWLVKPTTIEGAKKFGIALAGALTNLADIVKFIAANHEWIKFLATAFLFSKGVELSTAAMRSMLSVIGIVVGENGKLASSTALARIQQLEYYKAVATGKAVALNSAAASAMKAKRVVAANQSEVAAVQANINKLREEAAQYQANIKLAQAQAVAARQAAFAAQSRKTRGVGEFGALQAAGASTVAQNARDALNAEKAVLANRQQLTRVSGELVTAQAALAGATARLTIAQRAQAAAQSAATLAARAGTVAMRGLGFVMSMLGGPIIGTILIAITALTAAVGYYNNNMSDAAIRTKAVEDAVKMTTPWMDQYTKAMGLATAAGDKLDKSQLAAAASAIAMGKAQVNAANDALKAAKANLLAAQTNTQAAMTNVTTNAISNAEGADATLGAAGLAEGMASRRKKKKEAELAALQAQYVSAGMARWKTNEGFDPKKPGSQIFTFEWIDPIKEAEKALQGLQDAIDAASASAGGGGSGGRISPAKRLEGDIVELIASQRSLTDLIDTLDDGSDAAADMRAKIAGMRAEGKTISPDLEKRAIEAARSAANVEQAYSNLRSIIDGSKDKAAAFEDALDDLGSGTDKADASAKKFARSLALMREQIIAADPELATDIERVKKLDSLIAQSQADQRFVAIAGSVSALTEELDKMARKNPNPDLNVWEEWQNKTAEIEKDLANIVKMRADIAAMTDGPEKAKRSEEADRLEKEALDNRKRYTELYVRDLEYGLEQEIRANEEALLTVDEARQRAYEREVARILALTDVSKMNAEERAQHEARLLALREQGLKAAADRLARDTETPMQKMLRDYQDTTARFKELQADWLRDAMEKFKAGELSFGDMVLKMVEDYFWMKAQAAMADVVDAGVNWLANAGKNFLSSMLGGGGGIPSIPNTPTGTPPIFGPQLHSGGLVSAATTHRMIKPEWFAGAPRYHTGHVPSLKSGEVPAILKDDEGVFTQEQMAALGRGGAAGGAPVNVEVNVINESGQPLDAEQGGMRFNGEQYIIDVVVNAAGRSGPLRTAIKGAK